MNDSNGIPQNASDDDKAFSEQLLPMVYEELRHLAAARLAQEAADHTLQPTALVHEAWLRLSGQGGRLWNDRAHFYRTAAQVMRRILIDHARRKASLKRASSWQRLELSALDDTSISPDSRLLLIDESLHLLENEDPACAEVVMLKFFTGLSNKEAASTLGVGETTIERRWNFAKMRLLQLVREAEGSPPENT